MRVLARLPVAEQLAGLRAIAERGARVGAMRSVAEALGRIYKLHRAAPEQAHAAAAGEALLALASQQSTHRDVRLAALQELVAVSKPAANAAGASGGASGAAPAAPMHEPLCRLLPAVIAGSDGADAAARPEFAQACVHLACDVVQLEVRAALLRRSRRKRKALRRGVPPDSRSLLLCPGVDACMLPDERARAPSWDGPRINLTHVRSSALGWGSE